MTTKTKKKEEVELEPAHKPDHKFRRFFLKRNKDISGLSGTGYVAEGVQFMDGTCVIKWTTETSAIGIYHSYVELIHIHGHGGATEIEWVDCDK